MKTEKNRFTIQYVYPTQAVSVLIVVIGFLVDGIMINTFLGDTAQAAYGLTAPLTIVNAALCGLISSGVQVLMGRSTGGNDPDETDRIYTTAAVFGVILSLCVVIPVLIMPKKAAVLLGATNDEMIRLTAEYIQMIVLSFPLIMVTSMFPALFTLSGRKKTPMISAILLCISDIVLNYLNIKVIHWGMRGMALATVLSYVISFAHFTADKTLAPERMFTFRLRTFERSLVKKLLRYGSMYFVYKICTALLSFVFTKKLSSIGDSYLTANAILINVALVTEAFTSASNNTTNMLCSYWIGKKDNDGLRKFMYRMTTTSVLIHICLAAICILSARAIVGIFHVESEQTFELAVSAVCLYSLCMPVNAVNGIYRAYDLCTDRRRSAYILTVFNFFIMPVAAMLLIVRLCEPKYFWAAYAAGQGLVTLAVTGKMLSNWRALKN